MKPTYKLVSKTKYIELTADIANEIWREVYHRSYRGRQLTTIIKAKQSVEAIESDMDDFANYFLVFMGEKPAGYFAWKMDKTSLHLMHLYILPEFRGKGVGRDIVAVCERLARAENRGRMWCTVQTKLQTAQQFFKDRGYRPIHALQSYTEDILCNEIEYEHIL